MFRASPWISFKPDVHQEDQMDNDVDMDAPQISTLREEETPPPPKVTRRIRLVVKEKPPVSPAPSVARTQATEDDVDNDNDEDEEDQLIDDDNDGAASVPPVVETPSPTKRKAAAKRKPRKSEKQTPQATQDEKKAREKGTIAHEEPEESKPAPEAIVPLSAVPPSLSPAKGGRKRAPRKPAANPRPKKAPKLMKPVIPPIPPTEDSGMYSDAAFTGTAASSPVTTQIDVGSPDPESEPIQLPPPAATTPEDTPLDAMLENVALPIYPLPNKPFPVQHPPKIATGFAPVIPLDRTGRKVRHWRVANREIRGIAGGRWFVHCWVGDKESEYASRADGLLGSGAMSLPRLVASSLSAPHLGRGKSKGLRGGMVASAGSSRAGSAAPDATAVRIPTKMRNIVSAAPSEPDIPINDMDSRPVD
ncbi:hypothetical protein PC9H_003122 [Pleurotus ostreatus]|uniref:Uncharacterized protein n=1 Tax=Pleurotus ostreatus TaxID=5322 RepID=A0A8H6ZYG3_PLEOS|nr:uncharacterized protein PC9H_003122 [Pleurotus ostreatus]KAF7436293.1 hypothetical protein PC9H_003122 [Pleurotus ostreatus]